ncbi:MAG TPA: restriction endonuclease [Firmicutes bacterium]|nr:restriction endonuclease [Bacillota bacterium]
MPAEVRRLFSNIRIWQRHNERAPHKPLLLLYALSGLLRGKRWFSYAEISKDVGNLLREFGPPRQTSPLYPFKHLASDGLWTYYPGRPPDFRRRDLLKSGIKGGFTPAVYEILAQDESSVIALAAELLEKNFPRSLHEDLSNAAGLSVTTISGSAAAFQAPRRDPTFRSRLLRAYGYSCAVCGFNVMLDTVPVGLEAAHIKWHQFGGPDGETNGLALCSLHHKLFDRGAFTLEAVAEQRYVLRVSESAHGGRGFQKWLLRYDNKPLRSPVSVRYAPKPEYARWHFREVFRGSPRSNV